MNEIRYCVVDNATGTVCYCYAEEQARLICSALAANIGLTESKDDDKRFAYEDMRDFSDYRLEEIRNSISMSKDDRLS